MEPSKEATPLRPVERGHEYIAGGRIRTCWSTSCDHKTRPAEIKRRAFPALAMIQGGAA